MRNERRNANLYEINFEIWPINADVNTNNSFIEWICIVSKIYIRFYLFSVCGMNRKNKDNKFV